MLTRIYTPFALSDHCYPANQFLLQVSSLLGTCVPTPLAFLSTLFGTLSIISWLFAQAPQCVKNYRLKTAAGLSVYFLVEWLLGDLTNLFGAILTNQATWQIIVATYYCLVDIVLVLQWLWYEQLHHGRRLRLIWSGAPSEGGHASSPPAPSAESQIQGARTSDLSDSQGETTDPRPNATGRPAIPNPTIPNDVAAEHKKPADFGSGTKTRPCNLSKSSLSPRSVLLISMLVCLARASPIGALSRSVDDSPAHAVRYLGPALSWASTLLYLGSRIPQIVKNFRRRSTAGLSPLLFAAAFCGNLFYSASMIANPCAWSSYPRYGGRGWVRREGSEQIKWIKNALPFFLGAAGVLVMDASVGIQFWVYGDKRLEDHEIIVVESITGSKKWQEVTGWMRGWKPTVKWSSRSGPKSRSQADTGANSEVERLIPQEEQPDRPSGYGSLS